MHKQLQLVVFLPHCLSKYSVVVLKHDSAGALIHTYYLHPIITFLTILL